MFANLNRKKITSPKTYWHFAGELGHGNLAALVMDYLKIPPAYVHNDLRNRLTDETSKKLVNTYFTLRSADEIVEDVDDFEIQSDEILGE